MLFGAAGHARDLSLQVEVKPTLITARQNQDFSVETAIRNTGSHPETIEVWSCSYPSQWASENQAVKVKQVGCDKNYLARVKVNPGEAYTRTLTLRMEALASMHPQGPITFRLRFSPKGSDCDNGAPCIWSNAVSINVE